VAGIIICLICQTTFLLDRQLKRLEQDFLKDGGLRERMARARDGSRKAASGAMTHTPNARFNLIAPRNSGRLGSRPQGVLDAPRGS